METLMPNDGGLDKDIYFTFNSWDTIKIKTSWVKRAYNSLVASGSTQAKSDSMLGAVATATTTTQ